MLKIIYDRYSIDEYGNIYDNQKNKYLKQYDNGFGYKYVMMIINGKYRQQKIHRLVAKAFIENPLNKPFVNHLDCNRSNNYYKNLEWCTQKENIQYMDKLKRRVANKKLNEEEVKIIKEKKKQGYFYKDIWKLFKNKITLSGFEKIWYGQNWRKGDNK